MLDIGPFKITVSDLLTTLSPGTLSAKETKIIKEAIPTFEDGWLTDKVRSSNAVHSCLGLKSILIFK